MGFINFGVSILSLGFPLFLHAAIPQVIHIGNGAEPKDLDPHTSTGVPEWHVMLNLFEPLVEKDPKTLEPVPAVAESWTISKDGKVFTFKIRKSAKWSNGERVQASDFIYSITRLLTPAVASEYAQLGYVVKNGKAFHEGKLKDKRQLGLRAVNPETLEITLENPTPYFLGLLAHHTYFPVHEKTVEKYGARWTRPEHMVSNNAFVLSKWEVNNVISLKSNPHYWNRSKVLLTEAHFYPVEKQDTEEKMFRANRLHVTNEVPLEKIPTWQKDSSGVYQQHPYMGTYYYWINVKRPPLDNKLLRKALNLAIDREKLVKYVTRGGQLPGTHYVPPGVGGYQPKSYMPRDLSRLAEAKKLLAEAGYPNGKGLPPIELLYNTSDAHKKIAEAIQQMLKVNLGIEMRLHNQEWKVYLNTLRLSDFQLGRQGWIGDYNDPDTFLNMFITGSELNRAQYSNKDFDHLLENAAKELNKEKRLELFGKAEAILMEDLPLIPLYIYTHVYLKSPLVQGWYNNIEDYHPLKYVSLGPPEVTN